MTIERFRTLIARRLGLAFDDGKLAFLAEVLQRRADATGRTVESYLARLDGDRDEIGPLASELTVGETYFFRNVDQFRALVEVVFPDRIAQAGMRRSLRILSAGCASGEEAYTIAMQARELADAGWEISIRAVDVNPLAVERAARGRYSTWALRETPDAARRSWFSQDGRDFVLDGAIREAVRFEHGNLIDLDLGAGYDVIFCRNVIMYFAPETQVAVVSKLEAALAPGGYLFLGHAETLRGLSDRFHLCHTHQTFYYQRRRAGDLVTQPTFAAPSLPPIDLDGNGTWIDAIQRAADRIRKLTEPAADVPPTVQGAKLDDRNARREALELLRTERYADALAVLDQLPSSRDRDTLLLQAVLLVHGGRLAEAEAECRRLLALDELDAGAHYVFALCCEAAGDRSGAIGHDQAAAYLDPSFAMPRLHLGLLSRRAGDHAAARRELAEALHLLRREDASRLLLFGGGFEREALAALCRAELAILDGGKP